MTQRRTPPVRAMLAVALSVLFVGASTALADASFVSASPTVVTLRVSPAQTQPQSARFTQSISSFGYGDHYIARPAAPAAQSVEKLFVLLGGSVSVPLNYQTIIEEAALAGFDAIGLAYPNNAIIQLQCRDDSCYENLRGEIAFGRGVSYSPGSKSYRAPPGLDGNVYIGDSIINRLICLIDYLAQTDSPNWSQYLRVNGDSPYFRPSDGKPVYPDWSRIVLGGHSQGGGEAAFISMNLPEPVSRVVLLSSPQDSVKAVGGVRPADWITQASRTPLNRWFGLRHAPGSVPTSDSDEGIYGDHVNANWQALGGQGLPGAADGSDMPASTMGLDIGGLGIADLGIEDLAIGLGIGSQAEAHRLFTNLPYGLTPLISHDSTAKDGAYSDAILPVWGYLLGSPLLNPSDSKRLWALGGAGHRRIDRSP